MNNEFVNMISERPEFELIVKPVFNITCFRYHPHFIHNEDQLTELNQRLVKNINSSGKAYLTHTIVKGKYTIRFVPASTYVERRHIMQVFELIVNEADLLL